MNAKINSMNTYSPLYSSYENINIYKQNRKYNDEDYETSTANISCDSKGRILVKDSENEVKNTINKNRLFSSHTIKNIRKHENMQNIFRRNGMKEESSLFKNDREGKNVINDSSIPTKKILNPINAINFGSHLRPKNGNCVHDRFYCGTMEKGNNGIYCTEKGNVNGDRADGTRKNHSHIGNSNQFRGVDANTANEPSSNHMSNNSTYKVHNAHSNRNVFYEYNRNVYDHYNRIALDQYNRQVLDHYNRNFKNHRFSSFDNNYSVGNKNSAFLNEHIPINFYSNNNNKLKNYISYYSDFPNVPFIPKNDVHKCSSLHILKPTKNSDQSFAKNIFKIFNRKKDTNKNMIHSFNSSEFLPETEKRARNTSINKSTASSFSYKKKISNNDTSNTKSEGNNTLNRIYNFIFPSNNKRSQKKKMETMKEIDKYNIPQNIFHTNLPYKSSTYYIVDSKSKERLGICVDNNSTSCNHVGATPFSVIHSIPYNGNGKSAVFKCNRNNEKAYNLPPYDAYIIPEIAKAGSSINPKRNEANSFFGKHKSFSKSSNGKNESILKNTYCDDRHKYHEKIITNIYQFTGGTIHKQHNTQNALKGGNQIVHSQNYSSYNTHNLHKHNGKLGLSKEHTNLQMRVIENSNSVNGQGNYLKQNGFVKNENEKKTTPIGSTNLPINPNSSYIKREADGSSTKHAHSVSDIKRIPTESCSKHAQSMSDIKRVPTFIDSKYLHTPNISTQKQSTPKEVTGVSSKQFTYNNKAKVMNDNDKNNIKQNVYNYSTIIQNNFINNSEKKSKSLLNIKNENSVQSGNDTNLAFINVNKYINNIFKTNSNISDGSVEEKGQFINKQEKRRKNHEISSLNTMNKEDSNVNYYSSNDHCVGKMGNIPYDGYVHSEKIPCISLGRNPIMDNENRLRELEKKHGIINTPNLYTYNNNIHGINENTKRFIKQCVLNKFVYERNKDEEGNDGKNEPISIDPNFCKNVIQAPFAHGNISDNPIVKLITRNKKMENNEEYTNCMRRLTNSCSIMREGENLVINNTPCENEKYFSNINLVKNETKKGSIHSVHMNRNGYIHSVVSSMDGENPSFAKKNYNNDLADQVQEKDIHCRNVNYKSVNHNSCITNDNLLYQEGKKYNPKKNKIEIKANNIQAKVYNKGEQNKVSKNEQYNMDEILFLKSKVYEELNTFLKCLNSLAKNKKLYEKLRKCKNRVYKGELHRGDPMEQLREKLGNDLVDILAEELGEVLTQKLADKLGGKSDKSYSDVSESYYTMKNSHLSSFLCNENITHDCLEMKKENTGTSNSEFLNSASNHMLALNKMEIIKNKICGKTHKNKTSIHFKDIEMGKKIPEQSEENKKEQKKKKDNVHFSIYNDMNLYHVDTRTDIRNNKKENKCKESITDKRTLSEIESPNIAKKKALIITLNYGGLLEGCINDTIQMCDLLLGKFHFNELILLNDCNFCYKNFVTQKAKKKNIINNLHDFVINSNNGDILFFYFCGYSIKLIDSKFSEQNNFALLPQDYSKNNYIYSNEIYNIIKKLEGGKQLCIIFDTTYTSYFVPIYTSITYNKNINTTEISKNNYFSSSSKKHVYSLKTFGKIRDRHVESVYMENLKKSPFHEVPEHDGDKKALQDTLVPSIFFFSPDVSDRNDFELLIKNKVRGVLTYCIGRAVELLKRNFSYHDLFVVASQLLVTIKKEYKIKYIKFKLSFSNEHSPDDIKFLSHESLFLYKKKKLEEPLWKPSLRLNNLNEYMKNIYQPKEKKIQPAFVKKCLIIFIKDIKFCAHTKIDISIEYFVSSFVKTKNVNILYVRRNNTKSQKVVRDKIFFLEYIILNISDVEDAKIYVELFKKKKKNYFVARSVFRIKNTDGKFSLTDEKKNIIGIIDLNIKCVS
ncbi:cleavage and polyadenylation specificity factor subunit 3, putative [Plasmodium ovale]|uniref:Cleavage and polyadenylation specificity factor subunit 3, putative n=1 Tax=Plasmodium ovale TaxID=36330 RepID=A0A1D3TLR5_PLAOA|nr:cleavage and polyadenylation specificity factor subunit 3, putative [Plasmodium ovale]